MSGATFTRRQAFEGLGALIAGASLAPVTLVGESSIPLAPRGELVNVFEFEDQAKRMLSHSAYTRIAGTDHEAFERMTLRPRMVVDCMNLDLTADLWGEKLFAPILVGPVSEQRKIHPDGETATARGAAAAKTVPVVSSWSSSPVDEIAAQATSGWWYQAFPEASATGRAEVARAVKAGCKAICLAARPLGSPLNAPIDWTAVERFRQGVDVPLLLKGIMTPEDAKTAIGKGVQGIVVSAGSAPGVASQKAPIDVLPTIVQVAGPDVPVLVDGSFRRGSDILKALALGARAVLVARPVMWGLAAYGADGVQTVLELLQMDLARMMAGCGKPNLAALDRTVVRVHSRASRKRRS